MTHVWKTRDGKEIPVRKMEDSHLQNAIAWAERNICRLDDLGCSALTYASTAPDGASYAAEQAADEAFDDSSNLSLWRDIFQEELERRSAS